MPEVIVSQINNPILIAFTLYLALVALVAVFGYFATKNLSDFILGGRSLSGPVAALSAGASDMSAWLLMGLPGLVYLYGLNQIWLPIGLTLGAYSSWKLLAKPLRIFTEMASDSVTIPAFLENRFKDKQHLIRAASSLSILTFFAVYTASGLIAGAFLLSETFAMEYFDALLLGTAIIVGYTFIGGFLAVSWTDFAQGILMFCFLMVVPVLALSDLGGLNNLLGLMQNSASQLRDPSSQLLNPLTGLTLPLVINLFAWGIGYFGQPHILVRYMAIRSVKEIAIARRIAISWMFLSMLGAVLVGIVGIGVFPEGGFNHETIFIKLSNSALAPWLSGIIMGAILSSIMCAIDSQMLASSSALTEDIYHAFIRPKASNRELVWVGRAAIMIIAFVAFYIACDKDRSVIDLVAIAWAGLAASFGPAVIGALFWRRATRNGAVLSVMLGGGTVLIWGQLPGSIFEFYEMIPGYIASTLGLILGSLTDDEPSNEVTHLFDQYRLKYKPMS